MNSLTPEQQKVIDEIKKDRCSLVKIDAVAGAGKTHLLIEIAKQLNVTRGLYISYNKAIADEASEKFGANVECKTIHALAYGSTVRQFGLKLGPTLKARMITEKIDPIRKSFLVDILAKYFLSRHITIQGFIDEFYEDKITQSESDLLKSYFIKMKDGKIECTHDFYLKLFHILMHHNLIKQPEYDFLALDESGDITGVSLEIFMLLNSKKKVMTGDRQQNIYSFNQTINGFKALKNEGVLMPLTMSYRVSSDLAPYVEEFCHAYLSNEMEFKGLKYTTPPDQSTATFAYIARTNAGIINRMIELDKHKVKYNLTRPVKSLFQLPLILMGLRKDPHREINTAEFKFLEADMKEYNSDYKLQRDFGEDVLAFLENVHGDDIGIVSAISLIKRFGNQSIYESYYSALEHEKHHDTHQTTITSAHSSKGLTFDSIYIEDDLNNALDKVVKNQNDEVNSRIDQDKAKLQDKWFFDPMKYEFFKKESPNIDLLNNKQLEEFRLYYVAITRGRYQYENAQWLSEPDKYTSFSMSSLRGDFE